MSEGDQKIQTASAGSGKYNHCLLSEKMLRVQIFKVVTTRKKLTAVDMT